MQDCPEALLPFCNVPLLEHLLRYMEKSGFEEAVLLAANERIRRMLDGLSLQMPIRFARSLASLRAESPTLLIRRLCLPEWDMGELHALCGRNAVRLIHADGKPCYAELHPTGSALLEPAETAVAEESFFRRADDPGEYRELCRKLLHDGMTPKRIADGVRIGKETEIDTATVIGTDCVIGDRAVLEGCVIGDGVQVGAGAVLRNCVVCRHALVDREAHLENGVVPEGSILPPHARMTETRRLLVLPEDGICWRDPRWNTAETALRAGAAMTVLGRRIAIGYGYPAGEGLAMAAAAGAVSQGAHVWQVGRCVLSQLIYAAHLTGCDALLWVSGEDTVLLCPCGADGMPLTGIQTSRLQRALDAELSARIVDSGRLADAGGLLPLWEESCRELLPEQMPEIKVSCANAALRTAAEEIFCADVHSPDEQRITLTLSEDGTQATAFSMEAGLLRQEQLLLLSALSLQERGQPLVLPESFHPAAEEFASRHHARILRLNHSSSSAARTLYTEQGVCTDGVRLFAHVLRVLHGRRLTLRQASGLLPKLCTVNRSLATALPRQAVERLSRCNPDAAVQMVLPPQGRLLHLRVHADSMEAAAELCAFWEKRVRNAERTE